MKRYQNPEVFEPLAMAYALGTLQGKARVRFKKLMDRHFYLRVVTQAYEQQFAGLVGLLEPEDPPPEVWKRLESELGLGKSNKKESKKKPAWLEWLHWPAVALASVMAVAIMVVSQGSQPQAYFAQLYSSSSEAVAMAAVNKNDMKIMLSVTEDMSVKEDMIPTLWCFSKKTGEAPMRMGTVKLMGQSELDINDSTWQGLADVSKLVISLEPASANSEEPKGEVIFSGELMHAPE